MNIDPDQVIIASEGAQISHDGTGSLLVTIENENGATETVTVPAGQTVIWYPPAGWKTATFTAPGQKEEFRTIEQGAAAEEQEQEEG